jgi:O-glycosyl hydrolase
MKKNVFLSLGLGLIITMLGCQPSTTETSLRVAYDQAHQEIDGFGASDAWSIDPTIRKWMQESDDAVIERLADRLFSADLGIGLSAWRFNIGAGSAEQGEDSRIPDELRRAQLLIASPGGPIDRSKQLGQIRMLQEAHERGVTQYVAFANSPPHWATKNGLTHPGDGKEIGSTNLDPTQLDDFAEFLVAVVAYLRSDAVGVPVNYLSPINEPTWEWQGQSQEANRYNMEEVAAVVRRVAGALSKAGLEADVEVDGAEVVEYAAALSDAYKVEFDGKVFDGGMNGKGHGSYKNYIDELLGDPDLRGLLHNKISLHAYWSEASADRLGKLRDLLRKNLRSVSPEAKLWMSELCILGEAGDVRSFDGHGFEVDDLDYALHVARIIHRDLTRLDASAWFWWLALTPYDYKDGLLKIDPSLDAGSVQESKLMWTLGSFSRFIRPGYRRVELPEVDDLRGLMASAYKAPDDSRLVVVAINAGAKPEHITLDVVGLPGARAIEAIDIYVTDAEHDLARTESVEPRKSFTLPARSTTTFLVHLMAESKNQQTP